MTSFQSILSDELEVVVSIRSVEPDIARSNLLLAWIKSVSKPLTEEMYEFPT